MNVFEGEKEKEQEREKERIWQKIPEILKLAMKGMVLDYL